MLLCAISLGSGTPAPPPAIGFSSFMSFGPWSTTAAPPPPMFTGISSEGIRSVNPPMVLSASSTASLLTNSIGSLSSSLSIPSRIAAADSVIISPISSNCLLKDSAIVSAAPLKSPFKTCINAVPRSLIRSTTKPTTLKIILKPCTNAVFTYPISMRTASLSLYSVIK